MKALLLAAGRGMRLRPLTLDRPKVMVEIDGRPAIAYELDWLRRNEVHDVAINLFHQPEVVRSYVADGGSVGMRVRYSLEAPRVLGTAGALGPLAEFFVGEEAFVVLYGDVLTDLDLAPVLDQHRAMRADATMVVNRVENPAESGMVLFDSGRRVQRFVEKPRPGTEVGEWANAGIYVCGPAVFGYAARRLPCDFAYDVFPEMLAEGRVLGAFPTDAAVVEFGSPPRLERAAAAVRAGLIARPRGP